MTMAPGAWDELGWCPRARPPSAAPANAGTPIPLQSNWHTPPAAEQVCVSMAAGPRLAADALRRMSAQRPGATWVHLTHAETGGPSGADEDPVAAALGALPAGLFKAAAHVTADGGPLRPEAAAQLPRLCPRLAAVRIKAGHKSNPTAVISAVRSLGAVAGTLESLELDLSEAPVGVPSWHVEGALGAALARLLRLRRLALDAGRTYADWQSGARAGCAGVLAAALPRLAALTALALALREDDAPPMLDPCPARLRELALRGDCCGRVLGVLRGATGLAGVTRLALTA